MNNQIDPGAKKLIRESYALLKSGDRESARKFAQRAASLSPNYEQAWLILASLSEKDLALHYLENALRANPESQAAKKGIRVIFEELAVKNKIPDEEPAVKIEDTAPIPVKPAFKHKPDIEAIPKPPGKEEIEIPSVSSKPSIKGKFKKKPDAKSTTPPLQSSSLKKKNLRKKLSKPPKAETKSPSKKKTSVKTRLKKKIDKVTISQKRTQAEESLPAAEQKIRKRASADSADRPGTSQESPAPAMRDNMKGVIEKKKTKQAAEQPAAKPVAKTKEEKAPFKALPETPVKVKTKKESRPDKKKKAVKQTRIRSRKKAASDVDIIEVILISAAAVLLPLIAFLYFFLK